MKFVQIYREFLVDYEKHIEDTNDTEIPQNLQDDLRKKLEELGMCASVIPSPEIKTQSYQKSFVIKAMKAHMETALGLEHRPGDDFENLMRYSLKFGAPQSVITVTPKAHTTGMRLISVLSLNLTIMISTLEEVFAAFNRQEIKEDATTSSTKFQDVLQKADQYRQMLDRGYVVVYMEGDFSKFNLNIDPSDLLYMGRLLLSMMYGENSGLVSLLNMVEQQFCRKQLLVKFSQIQGFVRMIRDPETKSLSQKGKEHIRTTQAVADRENYENYCYEVIKQYNMCNPGDGEMTFYGSLCMMQNSAFLEGMLTNLAALVSSQSMKFFHEKIVVMLKQECDALGVEFDVRMPGDHRETSDDVIMAIRFKIVDREKAKDYGELMKLMQKYIDKISEMAKSYLNWTFKKDTFQPRTVH